MKNGQMKYGNSRKPVFTTVEFVGVPYPSAI